MNNSQRIENYYTFITLCIKGMIDNELLISPVLSGTVPDAYRGTWQTSRSFTGAYSLST